MDGRVEQTTDPAVVTSNVPTPKPHGLVALSQHRIAPSSTAAPAPPSQGNGNINIGGDQSGSNNINNTGYITIYENGQAVQCGLLPSDAMLPTQEAEAGYLRNFLWQLQHYKQFGKITHVKLSQVFQLIYDGMPVSYVDWVAALKELQREGKVRNVVSVPTSGWCYTLVGARYAFAADYEFDIVDVSPPPSPPSSASPR